MKFRKKIILVLCALTLVLGLAACKNTADNSKQDANSAGADTSQTNPDTKTADKEPIYPAVITDSLGQEITIESEPMKVVSMAPGITELIFKLGKEDKLIGRTTYCDYPKEAAKIEPVGTLQKPDIEKIISLEPDIVIASTHFSEESEKQLTDLGVKVLVLYEEHDMEGVYSMIETLGTILNANNNAAKIIEEMKTSIETTAKAIEGKEAPSVYYVVGFGEYGDYTAGGDTFISQLITLAGGENIAKDVSGWSYSLESLVEADPDFIIIADDMKDSFVTADVYKDLSAVKSGHVYGIDKNLLERQGYRNAQGIETLAKILHPEAFQE